MSRFQTALALILLLGLFGLSGICGQASAHAAQPKAKTSKKAPAAPMQALPQLLQDVETKYARAATLMAQFTQVNESPTFHTKKKSSGVIFFKRPDKIRWETLSPDKSIMVSDGKRFWFYTPPFEEGENGQVIERKSRDVKSKLANDLLSATFSAAMKANGLKIQQESPSRFILTPKKGSAGTVARAIIEVNPEEKLIEKVRLEHEGGNTSEISLSKIELGKSFDDSFFVFVAPPKTDRVTE